MRGTSWLAEQFLASKNWPRSVEWNIVVEKCFKQNMPLYRNVTGPYRKCDQPISECDRPISEMWPAIIGMWKAHIGNVTSHYRNVKGPYRKCDQPLSECDRPISEMWPAHIGMWQAHINFPRIVKNKNVYKIFVRKPEGKGPLGRSRHWWKEYLKRIWT